MIEGYKGRTVELGGRYKVYWNLHRLCWSLVAVDGPDKRKVCGHSYDGVLLNDATFQVSEAGRQRVIREGKKNVHAYVTGTLASTNGTPHRLTRVRYNPYQAPTFTLSFTDTPVHEADVVDLTALGKAYI